MPAAPTRPNWPPPDDEPIGVERARAYVAWIKQHAEPVLQEAERMLQERYPGTEMGRSSVTVQQLASWYGPTPTMPGLSIGCVWCRWGGGSLAMVNVLLDQEGRLVLKAGMNMGTTGDRTHVHDND